ncbi:hypothetical protein V8J82_17710 [Gymnodinialimonas sp. 2305UL16-5]|uniref:hypothetical protein n=1 Tax=Gymnodinialimonas mytili TaxID=3126503 RepID=UPI0030A0311F
MTQNLKPAPSLSDDDITTNPYGSVMDPQMAQWFKANVADPAWRAHGDKLQTAMEPLRLYNAKRRAKQAAR